MHGADGAMPPAVLTRWMLVTRLKAPARPADFVASSSQGIAPAAGASARAFTRADDAAAVAAPARTDRRRGGRSTVLFVSKSSASGATKAHSKPPSLRARHS